MQRWIRFGLVLAVVLSGCAQRQRARMYDGPELPPIETSLIVVQPDRAGVMLRIEAVDGVRMPGAEREFHDRDTEAIVRAGHHTVTVKGWVVALPDAPEVVLPNGAHGDLVSIVTVGPQTLAFTAEGGHDYVIEAQRAAFDRVARDVTMPLRPVYTQQWVTRIADRRDVETECPECPNRP